jgi:hypothetical protein
LSHATNWLHFSPSIFWRKEKNEKTTLFLTFFGAKKEAKKLTIIHSLAQRTNQETSTLTKPSPILEGLTEEWQRPLILRSFW